MSEEDKAPEGDTITMTKAEFEAKIAEATGGLKAKVEELLGETKAAKDARKALEIANEQAEAERQKKAGEWQAVAEKREAELEKERAEAAKYRQQVREKDLQGSASQIAGELTRDTARAALLAKEAQALMKHTDEGVQYEIGGVPVDRAKVLDHLRTSYPFLADGSQASGGGATGGNGGAGNQKPEEMSAADRTQLLKDNPGRFYQLFPHAKLR